MKKFALLILLSTTLFTIKAQVLDGIYVKHINQTRATFAYTPLREADVMWAKRIWRVIDMREKINQVFYFPTFESTSRKSLIQTVRHSFKSEGLTAFDPITDDFTIQYSPKQAYGIGESVDTIMVENIDGDLVPEVVYNEFPNENVLRFRIKEDWYKDKQKSVMEVRIIGFCPVITKYDDAGEYKGEQPLYWVYFPEIRPTLANQQSFNNWNDAEHRTYDDLFQKRIFSSYIYKKNNRFDRKISEYKQGLDALLESKKIENDIFNFEQDLWEY